MIGVIGAMQNEISSICAQMTEKEEKKIYNYTFYKGNLFGKEIVLVQCGIGKVNAGLCTQLLVTTFNVDCVINTGIAGAIGKDLKIYDYVVSTEAVFHDFDIRFFGYPIGQIPGLPARFKADEKLVNKITSAFEKTDLPKNHKLLKGLVASGDQFINSAAQKKTIIDNFDPMCVEMEGAAIAQACTLMNVPFAIIRCMSDTADESVQEQYSEDAAAETSSKLLMEIVKNF